MKTTENTKWTKVWNKEKKNQKEEEQIYTETETTENT